MMKSSFMSCGKKERVEKGVEVDISQYTEYAFSGSVSVFTFKIQENRDPVIKVDSISKREFSVDLLPIPKIKISIDGENKNPTSSNIDKALAYVQIPKENNETIFKALSCRMDGSVSKIVKVLLKNPWIEKIYSAGDKELRLHGFIYPGVNSLNLKEKELAKILKLNKSLFRWIIDNRAWLNYQSLKLTDIWRLIERYGIQVTENILREGKTLLRQEITHSKVLKLYIELLLRNDTSFDYLGLSQYLGDSISTYQGIMDPEEGASLLIDYIDMCNEMGVAFEKYPRSLKLVHDISAKNLKIILDEKEKAEFQKQVNTPDYQSLAMRGEKYSVIIPKTSEDVVFEGSTLNHCVGSYLKKITHEGVKIVFLRKTEAADESLVTLDVRNHILYQAAGFGNRNVSEEEAAFIRVWAKEKGIETFL